MKNRELREKRTREYFITAASKIINESSIDEVTIRKVADEAGFNSATLYNYFDNLESLITLSLNDFLEHYIDLLIDRLKNNPDVYDTYKILWVSLWDSVCKYPDEYYYIYFNDATINISEVFEKYFENNTSKFNKLPKNVENVVLTKGDIEARDKCFLKDYFNEFNKNELNIISSVVCLTFRGMVRDLKVKVQEGTPVTDEYTNKYEQYFDYITKNLKKILSNN